MVETNSVRISWEEFLQKASIKTEENSKWTIIFENKKFKVHYESFLMFPLSLSGASVFHLAKIKNIDAEDIYFECEWEIYVKADCRYDCWPNEEILRVVWCHLDRKKYVVDGDTLYEYDRLDKSRPEDAIGDPIELPNGIKKWKLENSYSVAETYLYVALDGRREDIILIDTIHGYLWETSCDDCRRYNSLKKAERATIKHLLKKPCKTNPKV